MLYELIFSENKNIIFLISIRSILHKVIPLKEINQKRLVVNTDKKCTYETLIKYLNENMYERVEFVRNKGEFAIRGDIIDVFTPNEKNPARISFEFDNVESLNLFDVENQKSFKKIFEYHLFVASEILFNDSSIKNFRQTFRKLKLTGKEEYYKSISNKILLPGSDQFYPILFKQFDSIIAYLSDVLIFIQNDFFESYENEYKKMIYEFDAINNLISKETNFLQKKNELQSLLSKQNVFFLYNYFVKGAEFYNFSNDEILFKNKIKNFDFIIKSSEQKKKIIFCTQSNINKKKLLAF